MQTISDSSLWKSSIGEKQIDQYETFRMNLLSAYENFRKNTMILSAEIARDLPNFTVHDITHIDALWETASKIVGEGYELNPMEAFVLGSAILLHDLGMASAAYVDDVSQLFEGEEWEDIVEYSLREELGRIPTQEERENIPKNVLDNAKATRLRELHATHAENLVSAVWTTKEGQSYRLLEDQELLAHFGEYIGLLASSHGWSIEKMENVLNIEIGAPPSYPDSWSVDILKLACILRVADAAHLDSRRAPAFLRALRKPEHYSDIHWKFQGKLSRPTCQGDQLVFTSVQRFNEDEIDAWWLAYENLSMVNNELKSVDRILKEKNKPTFIIKGVKGIESPTKLSEVIRVNGWEPVSASLHVSDVPHLVKQLGGEGLYGKDSTIPLRELIQNARDALHARRTIQNHGKLWGSITIKVGVENSNDFIEIIDSGIGMSQNTLCQKLLAFGSSYWGSYLMTKEHPGLLTSNFESIGKFGIGFYSTFMWGERVVVKTRTIYDGPSETKILEFGMGLSGRPILKKCNVREGLQDPGTSIRIYLENKEELLDSMLKILDASDEIFKVKSNEKLASICRMIAPTLDVDLYIQYENHPVQKIIEADDWKNINPVDFIISLSGYQKNNCPDDIKSLAEKNSVLVKPIFNEDGVQVGRAGISPTKEIGYYNSEISGYLTCGGLYVEKLRGVFGVVVGKVDGASRSRGVPVASEKTIATWATEQGRIILEYFNHLSPEVLNSVADIIYALGGNGEGFPLCYTNHGWLNYSQIKEHEWSEKIGFTSRYQIGEILNLKSLEPNVIATSFGGRDVIFQNWRQVKIDIGNWNTRHNVLKALAEIYELNIDEFFHNYYNNNKDRKKPMKIGTTSDGSKIEINVEIIQFTKD
ncbi:ATP-binding protein [Bacillus sp. FSL R5-0586]|uniref:HD domain-containing protein n=1 Tax=Bacillus TaxID=1386 RepID=UPI00203B8BE9|nr:ATP-binding protein [Bacillus altitudinis]MCM3230756.1 ATP-binding protein [Bacillus altitudinis]